MKNILMFGAGGREAAIAKELCKDPTVGRVYCSPGSVGIRAISSKIELFSDSSSPGEYETLMAFAKRQQVSLTIVGPEIPLVDGIVDVFTEAGLPIVGPTKAAAQIEGSKVFVQAGTGA